MRITTLSDTHGRHLELDDTYFPGGDLIIHAGDFLKFGTYKLEFRSFCTWLELFHNYEKRLFIAGNHDIYVSEEPDLIKHMLKQNYRLVNYLQDEEYVYGKSANEIVKIYGSPYSPTMEGDHVFVEDRDSEMIRRKWNEIPEDTDILVTHSPPYGVLDHLISFDEDLGNIGCRFLAERVKQVKPKIHIFGHCHGEEPYHFDGETHYINAAIMDDKHFWHRNPITFDWNLDTNEIKFI